MELANFEYNNLENFQDVYNSILEDFFKQHMPVYDKMFKDEIYGYRKGYIELQLDITYFSFYLYRIFSRLNNLEFPLVKEDIEEVLEEMQWECVVETLLCRGIRVGKYYSVIINLDGFDVEEDIEDGGNET